MTRKEFVEKLFGTQLFSDHSPEIVEKGCQCFACPSETWCESCEHAGFWNKTIDLQFVLKSTINMLYGTEETFVIGGRGAGKTRTIEHAIELQGYQRFPRILDLHDFETIHEIIDDALDNGFEFKLYNSTLYYREKDYANTDSTQDVD